MPVPLLQPAPPPLLPPPPTVNGGCTSMLNVWLAFGPQLLEAVIVIRLVVPTSLMAGVPDKMPVAGSKLSHAGKVDAESVGNGMPVAVTV